MKTREIVYALASRVPKGKATTYAEIARKAKTSPRAAGRILSANRDPKIPCHRVVCSDCSIGGYNRGVGKKIKILEQEGVAIKGGKVSPALLFLFPGQ